MNKWVIDPDHSIAAFSIRHMMIANIHGLFSNLTGALEFDPADMSTLKAEAEIDVSTLWTGIKKRDQHLLSPDFFDADKYPGMAFRSTKSEPAGGSRLKLSGELTIHGVTRPVTFDVEYSGPVKAPMGGETSFGFTAKTSVIREDFGVNWNVPMENGGIMGGHEVQITLEVECDLV